MCNAKMRKGQKEYWAGYNAAKSDWAEFGDSYCHDQLAYGLNGKTNTYCRGYSIYYARAMGKLAARMFAASKEA